MWMLFNSMYVLFCMWIICAWFSNRVGVRTVVSICVVFLGELLFTWNIFGQHFGKKMVSSKILIKFATSDGLLIFQSMSCFVGEHIIVFSRAELRKYLMSSILTLCWLGWLDSQLNPWLTGLTLFNPLSIGEYMDIDVFSCGYVVAYGSVEQ